MSARPLRIVSGPDTRAHVGEALPVPANGSPDRPASRVPGVEWWGSGDAFERAGAKLDCAGCVELVGQLGLEGDSRSETGTGRMPGPGWRDRMQELFRQQLLPSGRSTRSIDVA